MKLLFSAVMNLYINFEAGGVNFFPLLCFRIVNQFLARVKILMAGILYILVLTHYTFPRELVNPTRATLNTTRSCGHLPLDL